MTFIFSETGEHIGRTGMWMVAVVWGMAVTVALLLALLVVQVRRVRALSRGARLIARLEKGERYGH